MNSPRDRHSHGDACSVTGGRLDSHFSADPRGSRPHIVQSEAFTFVQGNSGDPGTIIFNLKLQVWCVPEKTHDNQSCIAMAHSVVDRLLSDA